MTLARIALGESASAVLQSAAARSHHHETHQRPPLSQTGLRRPQVSLALC